MNLPFDKIYCLHLVEAKEREKNIKEQFSKIGILNDVTIWNTCLHPLSQEISIFLHDNGKFVCDSKNKGGAFNCTREHYSIIKTAYHNGLNSILIFEDDIDFCINEDYFNEIIKNIPTDFDILRFRNIAKGTSDYFYESKEPIWGTYMYALSRKGMEYYIDYINNRFAVADMPLFDVKKIQEYGCKNYVCSKKLLSLDNEINKQSYIQTNIMNDLKKKSELDIFKNNEILKKICEPAEGEFKQYFSEKERIIVTMTSWKKRIGNVTPVLKSILENTVLPDLIVVNLATEEFPNKEQDLPQELNDLIKEKNGLIEINWLKNNTKVWKKIFPTLFKYPNDCTINIDDDFLYPNDFVETFKNKHKEVPAKQLVGVDAKFWKGHNQHCGCASLDRLEWFGDAIFNINQNCLDNIGDDDFYTYCLYENKTETVFVGKKYFTNMKSFNSIEGFSRSAGLMSRTKINNVLNSLPSSSQTISSPKPVIQETKKEAINPLPKNVKLATNSLRILMNYH